jgi:predicted nucleotidyltransferase
MIRRLRENLDVDTQTLLVELRSALERHYGPRLRGLYLFGSYARGDQDAESDVDVLVALDDYASYHHEADEVSHITSPMSLHHGVTIAVVFVRDTDWRQGNRPFVSRVRGEALPV